MMEASQCAKYIPIFAVLWFICGVALYSFWWSLGMAIAGVVLVWMVRRWWR